MSEISDLVFSLVSQFFTKLLSWVLKTISVFHYNSELGVRDDLILLLSLGVGVISSVTRQCRRRRRYNHFHLLFSKQF